MRVCYLVLVYNNYTDSLETIEGIISQSHEFGKIDIIVIDNQSTPNFAVPLEKFCLMNQIQYIYRDVNDGYTGGNNFGWQLIYKKYDYVFVVNNDIILNNIEITERIIQCFDNNPRLALLGPTVYYGTNLKIQESTINRFFFSRIYHIRFKKFAEYKECASIIGCFLAIRTKSIDSPHLFDESLIMYGEELDLGLRVWKAGYTVGHLTDDQYSIYHKGGNSPFESRSKWKTYLAIRNSILAARYFNKYERKMWIMLHLLSVTKMYLNRKNRSIKNFIKAGFIHGCKLLLNNSDKNEILKDAKKILYYTD